MLKSIDICPNSARGIHAKDRAADRHVKGLFRMPHEDAPVEMLLPAGKSTGCHAPLTAAAGILGTPRNVPSFPAERAPQAVRQMDERNRVVRQLVEGDVYGRGVELQHIRQPLTAARTLLVPQELTGSARAPPFAVTRVEPQRTDEELRYLQTFLAKARRRGARSIRELEVALRRAAVAAKPGGSGDKLDHKTFAHFCIAEGFLRSYREVDLVCNQLAKPGSGGVLEIDIDSVVAEARGALTASRAAIVRAVWQKLDATGKGCVKVKDVLSAFDPCQMPCCRLGAMTPAQARLQLLEGLGIEGWTTPSDSAGWQFGASFAMDEVAAGRRAKPIGAPGKPLHAPAGKPGDQRASVRPTGDVKRELKGQPTDVLEEREVTFEEFEAYYTAVSTTMSDERQFKDFVELAWVGADVHAKAEARRTVYEISKTERAPAIINIMTTFEDGSRRKVVLADDEGLAEGLHRAGTENGQIWSWGPEIYPELVCRLRKQGIEGIKSIKPGPF
eukprot:TRINITY_DN35210_c0_g1_i1.p1 TRINITY_DN35210_c0_g1~~TRINITY_DN35210_c0_g1_i1.p1  ORF type:complete len:502 (+),score=106.26 TRINITY_DN35210_c0_g1_i1:77-1582(+)